MRRILLLMLILLLTGCSKQPVIDDNQLPDQYSNTIFEYESTYEENVYNWIASNQLDNGLVRTTERSDYISLYDNALAAIVFTIYEDYEKAEAIFDFFNARIDTELNDIYGGFAQFRKPNGEMHDAPIGRRWLGDNAWLLIALNFYHDRTSSRTYQTLSNELEDYITSLQREDGGLDSGYDPEGNMMAPVTEAMFDSYNAVLDEDQFHEDLSDYLNATRHDHPSQVYKAWPGNEDYEYALDVITYGYLGTIYIHADGLNFAEERFSVTIGDITGYAPDEDLDVILVEHSLQMAVSYINSVDFEKGISIIEEMEKTVINDEGFPYATNPGTGYGSDPLWETAYTDIHLSPCAWYLFAINGINPMFPGYLTKVEILEVN